MDEYRFQIPMAMPEPLKLCLPLLGGAALIYLLTAYQTPTPMSIGAAVVLLALTAALYLVFGKGRYEYRLSGEGVEIRVIRRFLGEKVARTYSREEIEALTENTSEALTPYVGRGKKIRMRDFVSRKKGGGYILVADKDGCTEMALVELGLDALDVFQTAMPEKYRL